MYQVKDPGKNGIQAASRIPADNMTRAGSHHARASWLEGALFESSFDACRCSRVIWPSTSARPTPASTRGARASSSTSRRSSPSTRSTAASRRSGKDAKDMLGRTPGQHRRHQADEGRRHRRLRGHREDADLLHQEGAQPQRLGPAAHRHRRARPRSRRSRSARSRTAPTAPRRARCTWSRRRWRRRSAPACRSPNRRAT